MHISWAPSQKCDDSPGGNCALCNEFALQCLVCLGGYGFNSRGQCQKCTDAGIQLCLTCDLKTKPAKCLKCLGVPTHDVPLSWSNPGFPVYQAPNGRCKRCDRVDNIGCLTCDPTGSRCTQCNDGFYLIGGTCRRCEGENCEKCNQLGKCTKCVSSKRGPSYGLTAEKKCKLCRSEGCVSCDADWRKCTRCMDGLPSIGERGYGHDGKGNCLPCASPLCAKCQRDYKKCTVCTTNPYSTVPTYLTPTGQCKKCLIPGCMACSASGQTCTQCQDGYVRTADKLCAKLPKCTVPNCYDCRGNRAGCNKCAPKYYMAKPNRCQRCMERCEVCHPGKFNCKKCVLNYGLVKGACLKCDTKNAEYSFCEECNGNNKRCTKCWPADKFRPDPKTGGCVRYRLPDTIW